jgi:hypothetical protein
VTDPANLSCDECDCDKIKCRKSTGGTDEGKFTERYICEYCGATGTITGRAENPPRDWRSRGDLFA